ncbi:FkbM family methyltransferase [Paenibacillus herberti]|uniref:Methyltransferase FkbM domain-containing protein n=1 Tax=Paenibacillus herberti TaxID=1619309 RepID=A0A229NWA5_9BACL|nr:FkbM family methyltransferase [Paenibacillus herberti]OXM14216.1 hypothetical protein CGZ75_14735 [Paenibacillus herberti]
MKFDSVEHEVILNKFQMLNREIPVSPQVLSQYDSQAYFHEISNHINQMQYTRQNFAYRHLQSHRKILGKPITLVKKIMRKLLKWYIEPIAFQQTEFNNAVTPAIGRLTEALYQHTAKFNDVEGLPADMQKTNEQLHDYRNKLHVQMEIVNERISRQENETLELNRQQELYREKIQELDAKMKMIDKLEVLNLIEGSPYINETYSQAGEDSIIHYIISFLGIEWNNVTYIDLGANHAKELSNTYALYQKGAKGILVEANSNLIPELKFYRNRDTILNFCVDKVSGNKIPFYVLNGDGVSTMDYEAAKEFCEINPYLNIIETKEIETISYMDIVQKYLHNAPTVLSIDIEGKDLEVIESIEFGELRPLIIVIEMVKYDIKLSYNSKNHSIVTMMKTIDYDEYAFTGINSIFIDRRFLMERNMISNEYRN